MKLEEYKKLEAETGKKNAYEIAMKNYYDEEVDDDDDETDDYLSSELDESVLVELLDEGNEIALKFLVEKDYLDFEKLAREGHDWAVEVFAEDYYHSDAEEKEYLEFLLECADHGSSMAMDTLDEGFNEQWEYLRYILLDKN